MERPLELEGELLLDFDGGSARITIRDETVDLQLPDAASALAMNRQVPATARRDGLRRAEAVLREAGLVGRIRIRGRTVARLGGDARPGPVARVLGVDPLALRLFSLLGALLDRGRPADPGAGSPGPEGGERLFCW